MKAVVAAFNQEKALVGAFSVITNLRMELFEALLPTVHRQAPIIRRDISPLHAVSCHTEADNVWQLAATSPLVPVMFVSECEEEFLQGAKPFSPLFIQMLPRQTMHRTQSHKYPLLISRRRRHHC